MFSKRDRRIGLPKLLYDPECNTQHTKLIFQDLTRDSYNFREVTLFSLSNPLLTLPPWRRPQ